MNDEPNATMAIKWSATPDAYKYGIAAYHQSTNTSGVIATVTYSNLKNSYVLDSSGQKHLISKIVRKFSNFNKEISWGSRNTWKLMLQQAHIPDNEQFLSEGNDNTTFLQINNDPSAGAMYCGANSLSVADQYFDENGNMINPTGGYYVVSSLNHTDINVEEAGGTGVTPIPVLGSSISVLSNGNLGARNENVDGPDAPNDSWDNISSPYFYWGCGLMKITSSKPVLTFSTHSTEAGKQSFDSFWFTINTKLPMAPIEKPTASIHYHYDTKSVKILMPEVLIYGHFRHYLHVL